MNGKFHLAHGDRRAPDSILAMVHAPLLALILLAAMPVSAEKRPAAVVELRFLTYMEGTQRESLETLLKEFNETHPGIRATHEFVPLGNLKRQLTVANIAGALPDLTIIDNPDNASFAANGYFADITDLVAAWDGKKAFFPGPWASTMYKGRQYGVPFTSNCLAMFYDRKALAKAGVKPPETWDELRVAAKKLTEGKRYGFAISAVNTEEGTFQFLPWLISAGGSVEKIDGQGGVKSVSFLKSLIDDKSMSPEVIRWTQEDVRNDFMDGRSALMINGPWNVSAILENAPDIDLGIAKVPRDLKFASVLGGENIAITKAGKKKEAWELVKFLCSRQKMDWYVTRTGYFPPRADVVPGNARWNGDPLLSVFMDQMKYAIPRGPHPRWPELSSIICEAMQTGLSGLKPPATAMKEGQAKIDALLK